MDAMEHRTEQTRPSHCTFCDLIHGAAEVSICHEDSDAIAFMDIQPVNNGHVLVVPREHYESLLDVPEELGLHLFKITMRLANAVRKVTGSEDLNIVVNSGDAAGQDEPHYHVHIIPRRAGDGFDVPLPFNGSEMPDRTVLDAYAARIIAALRDPMRTARSGSRGGASDGSAERSIALPVYDDEAREQPADLPRRRPGAAGVWSATEGAHGELTYELINDDPAAG
jgi:histidine triad (HIT) family protein